MSTIAIVGAGPGLGLAIARTFGAHGFTVALIARNSDKLEDLVTTLDGDGIEASGFVADITDAAALAQALAAAADRFGHIDVLEFSPVGSPTTTPLTSPATSARADLQREIDVQLYGAMAATAAVLPAMRAAGAGTLLFTTGAGSIDPVPMVGNVNAAAAALRNWVIGLHKELADEGIQAAHVGIDVSIDKSVIPGLPVAPAGDISPAYWNLHTSKRDLAEYVYSSESNAPQTFTSERFTQDGGSTTSNGKTLTGSASSSPDIWD
ncbi:SDR family NAD(P)-dependent oxidoreductase [Rhodococcus erythropolis]|uniref:SDR family NAD(P)-dependent oxidoreductase n=1 Tax=Rhodococcus erythropolis TaxID=1833 RepID=UPI00381FD2F1